MVGGTAGLVAGEVYDLVINAGTVDSVSAVGYKVGELVVETTSQAAQRVYAENGYVVATTTNNSATSWNLTEIVDAQTAEPR